MCLSAILFSFFSAAQLNNNWFLSKKLNDNNGLPQNSVGSMYFDTTTNFLWLTTQGGLVRYDGTTTKVFDSRDLPSLKNMRLWYFFPTVEQEVLVCNPYGEVFSIKDNFAIDKTDYTSYSNYRNTNAKSLANLNLEAKIANNYADKFSPLTYSVWLNDRIWAGVSKTHIGVFNNEQLLHHWPTKKDVTALIVRNGFIYALNKDASGYCINLNNKTLLNTSLADNVLRQGKPVFFYDKLNDQPLLLNNGSLYEISFNKNIVSAKFVTKLENLPEEISSVIMHPKKKFVFVATHTTGVYIYRHSLFRVYKSLATDGHNTTLDPNNNYATVLTDSNHIFTSNSLLFDLTTGKSRKVIPSIAYFLNLGLDSSNNIWLPLDGSISSFNLQGPVKINRYPVENYNPANTFYLAKSGKFWISTYKHLGYDDRGKFKEVISYGKNDSASFFYLAEAMDGRLVGANQRGIFLVNTMSKKLTRILSDDQVQEVRNIHVDSADILWITTYGNGIFLYKLNENKFCKLPVDDKGYLLYSHAFIDDGLNNFLVPTNKGLFRLSRNNLLHICATPSTPLLYQYYDVSDGLLTNEFNGGCQPAFNRLPNNDIILPSLQGLVRVKVNELPVPSDYPLFIDAIETKRKKYNPTTNIHFEEDERTQTWYVSCALWGQSNNQHIFYRTDDDTVWQRLPAGEKKIQLNELTGGDHVLEIKNQYGLLQNQFSSLKFNFYVAKRYHETVWFWLSVIVILGIIIYSVNRFRMMQLKRNNKRLQGIIKDNTKELSDKNVELEETLLDLNEALKGLRENGIFKNRLIGLLGHDMLVPLRFIANISEHLYNNTNEFNSQSARESSGEIKTTAAQLLFLGESLIQWIKLEEGTFRLLKRNINIKELANEIVLVHKPMAAVKNNLFVCNIPATLSCAHDPTFIKVILHNLLLNANKFTSGGTITIQAAVSEQFLTIQVKDTGIGMEPSIVDALNNLTPVASQHGTDKETGWGMGYMLIIDLLRFANGKLVVESSVGAGTKVNFSLPCP